MGARAVVALVALLMLGTAVEGCSDRHSQLANNLQAPSQHKALPLAPPTTAFAAPQAWRPTRKDGPVIEPPDLALQTWYAFVSGYDPPQKKTPVWQPLPAQQVVEVSMPPDSRFRCFANPLFVQPEANELDTELEAWSLSRSVLCSSDGWRTFTEYPQRLRLLLPEGTRKMEYRSDALLRDRAADGTPRRILLVVRWDRESREASLGPPRILPGVKVDP